MSEVREGVEGIGTGEVEELGGGEEQVKTEETAAPSRVNEGIENKVCMYVHCTVNLMDEVNVFMCEDALNIAIVVILNITVCYTVCCLIHIAQMNVFTSWTIVYICICVHDLDVH